MHCLNFQQLQIGFRYDLVDNIEWNILKIIIELKIIPFQKFIPNSVIFIIILINGERTKSIIGSVGIVVEQLDDKLRLFQISFARSYIRTKRTTIFVCICIFFLLNTFEDFNWISFAVIIVCGICVLLLQYLIGVDSDKPSSIFYWLSFCIPKIGLMIFNFLFACYMMILLERLTMLGKALR